MDLRGIIRALHEEKARLDEVISNLASLTGLESGAGKPPKKSTRGRKQMPESERKLVSERMRKYWETKRKRKGPGGEPRM